MYIKNEQVYFQENVNRCIFNITREKVCFHSKNEHSVYTHSILRKGFYPLPSPIPSLPLSLMQSSSSRSSVKVLAILLASLFSSTKLLLLLLLLTPKK